MTEEPPNVVLVKLEEVRKELPGTNKNVGALANDSARWITRDFAKRG
jgi:hypothetical protein